MTEAIVTTSRTATELMSASAEDELRSMVHKIMRLTSGGRKLNQTQAAELAVYCYMTDLNPFNNEAYYLPNAGPIPGVAGVRRKANEYLTITSGPDDRFFVEFRDALPGEAAFDSDIGDIGKHDTLRIRSVSERWQQNALRIFKELITAGMESEMAWDRAERLNGSEPVWSSVGIVDHREQFGREPGTKGKDDLGTPDKWDRHERAEKRAEKWAIRKAFPSVILPDVDLGEQSQIDGAIVDAIIRDVTEELTNPEPPREESEILSELGFESEPAIEPVKQESKPKENGNGKNTEEIYQAVVDAKLSENIHAAKKALNRCKTGYTNPEQAIAWMTAYRGFRDMGGTVAQSAKQVNEGNKPK